MTSKRKRIWILGSLVAPAVMAGLALGSESWTRALPDQDVVDILSGIDFIPEPEDLPVDTEQLISIARDRGQDDIDPGVRVRAYSALALHDSSPEKSEDLLQAIDEHLTEARGPLDFVYLRAAIESLAKVDGPAAAEKLIELLDHGNRDIRTATARAIEAYGKRPANAAELDELCRQLGEHLADEQVPQVRTAVQTALNALNDLRP